MRSRHGWTTATRDCWAPDVCSLWRTKDVDVRKPTTLHFRNEESQLSIFGGRETVAMRKCDEDSKHATFNRNVVENLSVWYGHRSFLQWLLCTCGLSAFFYGCVSLPSKSWRGSSSCTEDNLYITASKYTTTLTHTV